MDTNDGGRVESEVRQCPVCGDDWVNSNDALEGRDGDTVAADKVCVEEFPDKVIVHFEEGEL